MRRAAESCLAALLLIQAAPSDAAEKGLVLRAGEIKAQPFIDAATAASASANLPVTIIERRGGWARVETNVGSGWIRLLNLRLEPGPANAAGGRRQSSANPLALLRTGSSSQTVATGVKGMDEADIRNASPDYAELELLGTLTVEAPEARRNAQTSNLKEGQIGYLDKGRGR